MNLPIDNPTVTVGRHWHISFNIYQDKQSNQCDRKDSNMFSSQKLLSPTEVIRNKTAMSIYLCPCFDGKTIEKSRAFSYGVGMVMSAGRTGGIFRESSPNS